VSGNLRGLPTFTTGILMTLGIFLVLFTCIISHSYRNQTEHYIDKYTDETYTVTDVVIPKNHRLKTDPDTIMETGIVLEEDWQADNGRNYDKKHIELMKDGVHYYVEKRGLKITRESNITATERLKLIPTRAIENFKILREGTKTDEKFMENSTFVFYNFLQRDFYFMIALLFIADKLLLSVARDDFDILGTFNVGKNPISRNYIKIILGAAVVISVISVFNKEFAPPSEEMFKYFISLSAPTESVYVVSLVIWLMGKIFPLTILADCLVSIFVYKNSAVESLLFMIASAMSTFIFLLWILMLSIVALIAVVIIIALIFVTGFLGTRRVVVEY